MMARSRKEAIGGSVCRSGRKGGVALLAALALGVPVLGGCVGDRMLDTGIDRYIVGGGPPPDAPSVVRGMSGEDKSWPNLASVPERPTDIPSLEQRQLDLRILEEDRAANRAAARTLEESAPLPAGVPTPTPVPPPPVIQTPGR